jgi:large subunit ribosomal protein L22
MKNVKNIEAVAYSRYLMISPFKVRRVIDQVRGRSCDEAFMILKFMPYKACPLILKVLASAVANAKLKANISDSSLFISEARVDAGPFLKRFRPHAQGRGFPIKKQMSHIIIKVSTL